MDIISVFVTIFFVLLTGGTVAAIKSYFGVSFLIAALIGVPLAWALGMLLFWVLVNIAKRRKGK